MGGGLVMCSSQKGVQPIAVGFKQLGREQDGV